MPFQAQRLTHRQVTTVVEAEASWLFPLACYFGMSGIEVFGEEMTFELHFEDPVEVSWENKLGKTLV